MLRFSPGYVTGFVTLALFSQLLTAAPSVAVSGTITSDIGQAITDAVVSLFVRYPGDLQPKLSNGSPFTLAIAGHGPLVASAAGNAAGTFQVSGIPDGQYVLCAHSAAGAYLDNCIWADQVTGVTVSGGASPPVALTLHSAAQLQVHVNDLTGALLKPASLPRDLILSVTRLNGAVVLLNQIASSAVGRDYQTLIPFNTALHLCIASSSLNLGDSAGKALAASTSMPVSIASAAGSSAQMTFSILGVK